MQPPSAEDGITLANIPQSVQVAQARARRRQLPREGAIPLVAELSAFELAIVEHSAAVILSKSALKDQMDMDEIYDLLGVGKRGSGTGSSRLADRGKGA
jgi:hypothetical protein